ncbi:MAG: tetratricopeptide repeat protein, partial [Kiritimatiellae bacterium]|nr:tetratricopeptide repeat protein [Kiritimatiellia bacterium]
MSLLLTLASAAAFAQEIAAPDRRAFADGLMSRGLVQLALPEYRALAADAATPERDVVLYRLAECARQTGDRDAAKKACAELLAKYPKSPMAPRARLTHGLILKDASQYGDAASVLDELATDPAVDAELAATALYHAAEAREAAGNRKGAESRYAELLKRAAAPGAAASVRE